MSANHNTVNTSERKFRIVLLEDDHFQAKDFCSEIEASIPDVEVEELSCEAEFLDRYERPPGRMPDLFIFDLMTEWRQPWVETARELPEPPPFFDEAGLRCTETVRKYSATVPIIIWSITNAKIPGGIVDGRKTFYFSKEKSLDGDFAAFIRDFLPKAETKT